MQHPHYSQVTTSEPTACTAPSPDSAALYSEPNSLCLQADPRACHGCTAAAAYLVRPAGSDKCKCKCKFCILQVPVSRPPPLSRSLFFSPSSLLQPPRARARARYSRTALISALRPSARPPLRLAIPRRHPVRILSAFSFPNRSSRLNRQLLVVSTALRDADPGLLGKPNARYWYET
jgi:hypothetical protein